MAINGQNAAAIKALVTGATTTEADFRTGTDHIIDQVDASSTAPIKTEIYNTGTGSYVTPEGVNKLIIHGSGGGGGGGAGATSGGGGTGGGGGAGGQVFFHELTVSPSTTYNIAIGSGGTGGTATFHIGNAGNAGNATIISEGNTAVLTLDKGLGGALGYGNNGGYNGGSGAGGAGGAVTGGTGNMSWVLSGATGGSGGYGFVPWRSSSVNDNTPLSGGAGGDGKSGNSSGGVGKSGFLIIQVGE